MKKFIIVLLAATSFNCYSADKKVEIKKTKEIIKLLKSFDNTKMVVDDKSRTCYTVDEESTSTNVNIVYSGSPGNDGYLSPIQNFHRSVTEGRFKAPISSTSSFNYVKDNYKSYFRCNIPFICSDNIETADIMTRKLASDGSISREESYDTGLSKNKKKLQKELAKKIQAAINRSTSTERYYQQMSADAFIFKPGDGFEYVVDLSIPLVGNPIFRRNLSTGNMYNFIGEK